MLLLATHERRIERIVETDGIDARTARKRVSEGDDACAAYLKRFDHVKDESTTDYHLVVDTDRLDVEAAAAAVVAAATT